MIFDPEIFAAFMVFAAVASITPGPNNLMLMASGTVFGLRRTIPHIAGVVVGFGLVMCGVVLGIGAVLEHFPWLTLTVRIAGTLWLGWLGLKMIVTASRSIGAPEPVSDTARPLTMAEVILFQWANPKALVMATSCASVFAPLSPSLAMRAAIITGGFALCGIITSVIWTLSGQALARFLSTNRRAQIAYIGIGLLYIATATGLIFV